MILPLLNLNTEDERRKRKTVAYGCHVTVITLNWKGII